MAILGVLHITTIVPPPSPAQTPSAVIISHVSDLYPTQSQQPFHLDHRLFVSTSSLLPHADNKRAYTHVFTSSHLPQTTFIGTTTSSKPTSSNTEGDANKSDHGLETITVPTAASLEPFTNLLIQKLQPQWAARQFLVLDNGATIDLPITDDSKWKISVGDVRVAQSKVSGNAAGQPRGILIEIQYDDGVEDHITKFKSEEKKYETLMRGLLKRLFKNLNLDLKLNDARIHLSAIPGGTSLEGKKTATQSQGKESAKSDWDRDAKPRGHEVAELYMDVLRGSRI